jgi:hypothetical protein
VTIFVIVVIVVVIVVIIVVVIIAIEVVVVIIIVIVVIMIIPFTCSHKSFTASSFSAATVLLLYSTHFLIYFLYSICSHYYYSCPFLVHFCIPFLLRISFQSILMHHNNWNEHVPCQDCYHSDSETYDYYQLVFFFLFVCVIFQRCDV